MHTLLALIPLLPLLGFVCIGLFGKKAGKLAVSIAAVGTVTLSFVLALIVFVALGSATGHRIEVEYAEWMNVGKGGECRETAGEYGWKVPERTLQPADPRKSLLQQHELSCLIERRRL